MQLVISVLRGTQLLLLVAIPLWMWRINLVHATNTFTTRCDGRCEQFTPCIERNPGETELMEVIEYACLNDFGVGYNATANFTLDQEVGAIGEIKLDPTTTQITLDESRSAEDGRQGKVTSVQLDSSFTVKPDEITDVALINVNVSSVVNHLSDVLPPRTTRLRLENALLTEFPTISLLPFRSLLDVNFDFNSIEEIDAITYSASLESLSLEDNNMRSFQGYFPQLQTLSLRNNRFSKIPDGVYHLHQLKNLKMTGNGPLSRSFTAAQVSFLRNLTWDLNDGDFAATENCISELQQIHEVSVCLTDSEGMDHRRHELEQIRVGRKLYDYEGYACPGYYSGGVLAGSIIGTAVLVLIVGGLVWRWKTRKHEGGISRSSDKPSSYTDESYASVWDDPQLLALRMQVDEIQDVRKIGGGAYADVWLVKFRGTQLLASKRIRKVHETQQNTQNFLEEIKMAARFDHPNVVKLLGAAWTIKSDVQALSEYMVGGDLRDFLVYPQTPRLWNAQKLQIATDVIEALVYLHSFIPPVVHRDLKSRNILLSREMRAKLTDFGVSRIMSEENTMTQGVGTSKWEAPKVLAGKEDYNQAADIFSFGVVLSELDTHTIPYDDARGQSDNTLANVAILQMIALGTIRPSFSQNCPLGIRAWQIGVWPTIRMIALQQLR